MTNKTKSKALTQTNTTMTSDDKVKIINLAVDALFSVEDESDKIRQTARQALNDSAQSLLGSLVKALQPFPEPITEDEWDKSFSRVVRARLQSATKPGTHTKRYKNDESVSVMLSLFKVATIAITFGKNTEKLAPTKGDTLTRYVARVRPMLQNIPDPYTGRPLLKMAVRAPKPPKVLAGDVYYWLVGFETDKGWGGTAVILGGSQHISDLQAKAAEHRDRFKGFIYLTSKAVGLQPSKSATPVNLPITNAAVATATATSVG